MIRAKLIHGDKFDYSEVKQIDNGKTRVPLRCTICDHRWSPTVDKHIHGRSGCALCARLVRTTLGSFLKRAKEAHGDKFDYCEVTEEHIINNRSRVPINCNSCGHRWSPTIHDHIDGRRGCPSCTHHIRINLELFLKRAREVHGDRFDYSEVTEDHVKDTRSKIPVMCSICDYRWSPTINDHINGQYGCPLCGKNLPWTLESFLKRAKEVHEDRYDYSLVTEEHIKGHTSKVPVICRQCMQQWDTVINNHINGSNGCPRCRSSKGEITCAKVLEQLGINFKREYILDDLPRKRYDFYFEYKNSKYLLEFDGFQHFESKDFFNKKRTFEERQKADILKTKTALESGLKMIRIDYDHIDSIKECIEEALEKREDLYLSDKNLYLYITNNL